MATQEIHAPKLGEAGEACRACGAPLATDQRYCLNCGERRAGPRLEFGELFGPPPGSAAAQGAEPPAPPPAAPVGTAWLTPRNTAVAAGLVVALLLVGGLIGAALQDPEIQVAAPEPVVVQPTAAPAAAAAAPAAPTEFVSDWSGTDGWTVQLTVLPKDGTDPAAVAQAKADATAKGAADVGALDSDEYPSLDGGSYIVYAGEFPSKKEAQAALKDLEASFPDAEVVEVSTATDTAAEEEDAAEDEEAAAGDTGGNGAETASESELQDLENSSGEDYVKESKKLKDDTATEGEAPPTDDAAPGGGDAEAETIG